jgi:hypothetical protein
MAEVGNAGLCAAQELRNVKVKVVKPYNVVYWTYRLSNFTVERLFETFLIPEYTGSSGRNARRIRPQEICRVSVVLSDCNQNWNNLVSFGEIPQRKLVYVCQVIM